MQPDRVSRTMKRLGLVVALVAAVGALWYLTRPRETATARAVTDTTPPASSTPRFDKVTRLGSPEQRRQVADRIASAQAARAKVSLPASAGAPAPAAAAVRAPERPRLPEQTEAQLGKTEIRAAMREVIPHLQHCYETELLSAPDYNVSLTASITLTGDPDVGTLIDADKLVEDNDGKPIPARFDDCLRSTFMELALPPLAEGSSLKISYPFMFRTK